MRIKVASPEFVFVFYIFGFATLRPVLFLFRAYSTLIVAAFIIVAVAASLICSHVFGERCFIKWLVISAFFEMILFFGQREISVTYMVNFFMYGVVALFLLMNVCDYQRVLYWVVRFSCINGVLLILDPFFGYQFNGNYMSYGFNMLMFSFTGLLIARFYYRNRFFSVPIVIELAMILFYGNKGAGITAAILLLYAMFLSGSKVKRLIYCAVGCIGALSWRTVTLWVIDAAQYFGINSYSITTLKDMLSDNADIVFSVRTDIWEAAGMWISQKPVFGYRVGAFEAAIKLYAHNVFYDITLCFGFVGLAVFIVLLLHSVYKMYRNPYKEYKLFQLCCLCCWLLPMQISLTLWNVPLFWVYWGLYFFDDQYKRQKIQSINSLVCT